MSVANLLLSARFYQKSVTIVWDKTIHPCLIQGTEVLQSTVQTGCQSISALTLTPIRCNALTAAGELNDTDYLFIMVPVSGWTISGSRRTFCLQSWCWKLEKRWVLSLTKGQTVMLDDWITTIALLLVYRDRSKVVHGRNSGNPVTGHGPPRFMDAHEDLRSDPTDELL